MEQTFKIRDLRKKDQYKIDDAYLNGYARICGVNATAVYNSLSRHADFHTQECFPSLDLIADQHGITKPTVLKAIKILEIAKIVLKKRIGKMKPNEYLLTNKTEWLNKDELSVLINTKNQRGSKNKRDKMGRFDTAIISEVNDTAIISEVNDTVKCSKRYGESEVNDMDCKDNTIKDNTIKVVAKQSFAGDIGSFILLFKEINPNYERLFSNKTQRGAIERMLIKFGEEKLTATIKALPNIINQPYAPKITTPYELERDLAKLIIFHNQNNNKKINIIV